MNRSFFLIRLIFERFVFLEASRYGKGWIMRNIDPNEVCYQVLLSLPLNISQAASNLREDRVINAGENSSQRLTGTGL